MYRALITDLDGTAVSMASDGSDVTRATQTAIANAHLQGKLIACATGRQWDLAKSAVHSLGLTAPCVIEGGARIIDPITEKTLWTKSLPDASVKRVFNIFKKLGHEGQFTSSLTGRKFRPITTVDDPPYGARIVYLLWLELDVAREIVNQINARGEAIAHLTAAWGDQGQFDIHVTHRLATKEHAILEWHKLTDTTKAQTIGMGDSGNDVPIFQSVGLRVAPTNANDEILALADYIAPRPEEEGLKHVIEKFLITD